jgi:hypothetical protein
MRGKRGVRSLQQLEDYGSSARVLNLLSVWRKNANDEEYAQKPFFISPILNRSIIVKHRLRQEEREAFSDDRVEATKVILPIDLTDVRSGARSFFVDQVGYDGIIEEICGGVEADRSCDEKLLQLISSLPSLDPFLMRERLRLASLEPARCYFDISEADTQRMFGFVLEELKPLISLSFDDVDVISNNMAAKLAAKIMANANDLELTPLRHALGLGKTEFQEGAFCWKGFLYYKWTLIDILPNVRPVMEEIAGISPTGPISDDEKGRIPVSCARLSRAIVQSCEAVRIVLKVYDDAYAELTRKGESQAFTEFLLRAPKLFQELGQRLGSLQHVVSFWRYRFPPGSRPKIAACELVELLADFEGSIGYVDALKAA